MYIVRGSWLIYLSVVIGVFAVLAGRQNVTRAFAQEQQQPQQQQRLVEDVDIQGNRRLRDEDLLYYVTTHKGDVYNPAQVSRDMQTLLSLGFFDKTKSRVLIQEGARGGVIVIFEVSELPVIRDIQFTGLKAVQESDVLKAFREQRVGIAKENLYDPVKKKNAERVIRELLAARGYPNATVNVREENVSATSVALTFEINQGERVRVAEIQFEGNRVFSDGALRRQMRLVREAGLISRFRNQDILDRQKLDYDLRNVTNYMRSKGYLQARTGEPRIEGIGRRTTGFFIPLPLLSSTDEALRITIPVNEGRLYRIGTIKIEGNSIFSEQQILAVIGLKPGDIADGERIGKGLFEDLEKVYGSQGFIQYSADPQPTFHDNPNNPNEGIVDFVITIDEGKQFTLRRLEFIGNTFTRDNVLRREVLVNEGDIYNQRLVEFSVVKLNQLGYFDPIDERRDIERRTNEEEGLVDVNIKVAERGRQQISFNGGVSGIGGSFFGLDYSTNNLFGRGEILSLQLAAGNRQRSFQFSFTEPYVRNRPITAGFSIFAFSQKFFGEGTFLSQNLAAQQGALGGILGTADFFNTSEENLFTRNSYGASFFLSAPLSEFYRKRPFTQFSRIGLSYQLSQSSVKQPAVNAANNPETFIPVLYNQPNIITSRITPTFVYDTRSYAKSAEDPVSGRQISASLSFSGAGGDVRTYAPLISYIQFFPVKNRGRDQQPHTFGFRLLVGHVSSFATSAKIRNANSLAFVNGVPIYERFFLGDEFTVRGYNVRSISPIAPLDSYVTTRNVVAASNSTGTPVPIVGLPPSILNVGAFTGPTGSNVFRLSRQFTSIGGDTQLLGNFEYRIPIFGPVSAALYADVGSSFNLHKGNVQAINSEFVADQPFLGNSSLSILAVQAHPGLALSPLGGLVVRDNHLVTVSELNNAIRVGPIDPSTGLPFGFQQVFLRGDVQTNTLVRVNESLFAGLGGNIRSSLGGELRFQVPVINVPFRIIYAYNPTARRDQFIEGFPFFFNERKSVFRFSVGRTF